MKFWRRGQPHLFVDREFLPVWSIIEINKSFGHGRYCKEECETSPRIYEMGAKLGLQALIKAFKQILLETCIITFNSLIRWMTTLLLCRKRIDNSITKTSRYT